MISYLAGLQTMHACQSSLESSQLEDMRQALLENLWKFSLVIDAFRHFVG